MNEKKLHIQKVICNEQTLIGILISKQDNESRDKVKNILGRKWHQEERIWTIPYTKEAYICLVTAFGKDTIVNIETTEPMSVTPPQYLSKHMPLKEGLINKREKLISPSFENNTLFDKLSHKQQCAVSKLEELLIEERKAFHTQKGYRNILIAFFYYYKEFLPSQISEEQIRAYILKKIKDENISKSTQNQIVSTFKAFYGRLLNQHHKVNDLYRPNKEQHLPKTLEPLEIAKLFAQVGNLKHKCILMLLYGSGLRVGEVVRLKWQDVDFLEKTIFIHNGKNYKDRFTILSEKAIELLKQYNSKPKSSHWVFESPDGGHYSERSVQQFFGEALAKAKIDKQVSTHSLRHAFATQLLKSHTDLDFVRKVMGHASIKTTQIYLHILKTDLTKTRSPLDDLNI